ncbi:putative MFS family arabinose efflux permease [Streptomyces sp. B3I8]|nr:putative MFS family arabinose efflux permease [Streptomyces sp. B3I8]
MASRQQHPTSGAAPAPARPRDAGGGPHSPWRDVARAGAALATGMGVGRFVYTPILPLMHAGAGLSTGAGANLATANYVGYLAGALAGTFLPRLVRSPAVLRGALLALVASLAAMPLTRSTLVWLLLRLGAGMFSALIFVTAASSLLSRPRKYPAHLPGWAFGGVGAGIALSGVLVLALRPVGDWRTAWWAAAALAAVLSVAAWGLRPESATGAGVNAGAGAAPPGRRQGEPVPGRSRVRTRRWFGALFVSYTLEGVGYIIAGTFLVAAVEQSSPGRLGSGAWVLVGLAAVPSSALWAGLGRHWSRPTLLTAALLVQAVGIALPALSGGVAAALISATLFGGTFIGVSTLTLATGTHLRVPRAVALLTAGYSVGQILGPLVAAPLLHHGYRRALALAAVTVLVAALAALVLRVRFPHRMPVPDGDGPVHRPAPDADVTPRAGEPAGS